MPLKSPLILFCHTLTIRWPRYMTKYKQRVSYLQPKFTEVSTECVSQTQTTKTTSSSSSYCYTQEMLLVLRIVIAFLLHAYHMQTLFKEGILGCIGVVSLIFRGHVIIWYPIGHFLLVVLWNQAFISSSFQDIQWQMWRYGWHDLDTTSKQKSRSFILVPIDVLHTTSYRLSIVTFALGRSI